VAVISKRFADELTEKEMRDAYLSAQTRTRLTNQIRAVRNQRGWSQGDFAKILDKPQSNVSRLESRDYGQFTLKTLFELASTFDCGLIVEFVSYEEFIRKTSDLTPTVLLVPPFNRAALEPLCRNTTSGSASTHSLANQDIINRPNSRVLESLQSRISSNQTKVARPRFEEETSSSFKGLMTTAGKQSGSIRPELLGQIGRTVAREPIDV